MQLCSVTLTGTKMSQIGKVDQALLQPGKRLSIHRRPDNAYDSQAMSVHAGEGLTSPQVGWIPAKEIEDKTRKEVLFNLASHDDIEMWAEVEQFQAESKFLRVGVFFQTENDSNPPVLVDDFSAERDPRDTYGGVDSLEGRIPGIG